MNWLSKESKNTSFNIMSQKDQKFKRKFTFDIQNVKFQNGLKQKTFPFLAFLRQTGLWEPVNNAEILAPELVGGQSEMVV